MIKSSWRGYNVEWGYAFDVHLNAFTPMIVISHFSVLLFYHCKIILDELESFRFFLLANVALFASTGFPYPEQFLPRLVSNSAWMLALCFYFYITFLGYKCKYSTSMILGIKSFESTKLIVFMFEI